MSTVGPQGTVTSQFKIDIADALRKFEQMGATIKQLGSDFQNFKQIIGTGISSPMAAEIDQVTQSTQQSEEQTQSFTQKLGGLQSNMLVTATSVGTFTASIFGIATAMDNLQRAEFTVEQQRLRVSETTNTLNALETRLHEGRESGRLSLEEISNLEDRRATLQQRLTIESEKLEFAQSNLNQDYQQFAVQILPQVISASLSGVTAITSIITALGKNERAVAAINKAWDAFSSVFSSSTRTATSGADALSSGFDAIASSSTRGQKASGLLVPALTAIGASAAIAGTAIFLYSSNAFGARDAMFSMGESIGNAVPPMTSFLNLLEHSGRLWQNIIKGPPLFGSTLGEMSQVVDETTSNVTGSLETISQNLDAFTTNAQKKFKDTSVGYQTFKDEFGDTAPYVRAASGANIMIDTISSLGKEFDEGKDISQIALSTWAKEVTGFADIVAQAFRESGQEVPAFLLEVDRLVSELEEKLVFDTSGKLLNAEEIKTHVEGILKNITDTIVKLGPEFEKGLGEMISEGLDPIGFHIDQINAKLLSLKLPPELALTTTRLSGNVLSLSEAWVEEFNAQQLSSEGMGELANNILPHLLDVYNEKNDVLLTENELLQLLVDTYGENSKEADVLTQALLEEAKARDIKATKTKEDVFVMTEEQQVVANLAQEYFNLKVEKESDLELAEEKLDQFNDLKSGYEDEIASLNELRARYSENTIAIEDLTDAGVEVIENLKHQLAATQVLTAENLKWNKITDGSIDSEIRLNQALLDGKLAFIELYESIVLTNAEGEAFGQMLSTNMLEVLEEFPDAIQNIAAEFDNLFSNFASKLDDFNAKIEPFDKESLKEYKQELQDLEVPKKLRKQFIESFKIGQDKKEIQAEIDALFEGIAGTIAHDLGGLSNKEIFKFVDELRAKIEEMGELGMDPAFLLDLEGILNEIENSEEPLDTLIANIDTLMGAFDLQAMDKAALITKFFGEEIGTLVQNSMLGAAITGTESLGESLKVIAGSNAAQALKEFNDEVERRKKLEEEGGGLKSRFLNNEPALNRIRQGVVSKALKEDEQQLQGMDVTTLSNTWQTFKDNMITWTGEIQGAIQAMGTNSGTSIAQHRANVVFINNTWAVFKDNLTTFTGEMVATITEYNTLVGEQIALQREAVVLINNTWVEHRNVFQDAMSVMGNYHTDFVDTSVEKMDEQRDGIVTVNNTWVEFKNHFIQFANEMMTKVTQWANHLVKQFDNVVEGAGEAEEAVRDLQDAIDSLKSKTVTVRVNVSGAGASGPRQFGGANIISDPGYVFAGEGHKRELVLTYPLDKMSQLHANSEFKLPFNTEDLSSNIGSIPTPKIEGLTGSNIVPNIPSTLNSNIKMNARFVIDLGSEIKKIVREEINMRAVTRLDRMSL